MEFIVEEVGVKKFPGKAIVIGMDGVSVDFLLRMVEEGKLPNFKRFFEEGEQNPCREKC